MTLPEQMTDRWARRADPPPGQHTLYWHVLMGHDAEVTDLANEARQRLAAFDGLHMTPPHRLHMTTLEVGAANTVTSKQLRQMTSSAAKDLARIGPITVRLGKVLYHPEAIMLAVTPAAALAPLRQAAISAAGSLRRKAPLPFWTPHITLCYSTSEQPAQPIIKALGTQLPEREIHVQALSLVIQDGPERQWNWTVVGTAILRGPARGRPTPATTTG